MYTELWQRGQLAFVQAPLQITQGEGGQGGNQGQVGNQGQGGEGREGGEAGGVQALMEPDDDFYDVTPPPT